MSSKRLHFVGLIPVISLLFITGCNKSPDSAASPTFTTDPAGGNLAPADASLQQAPSPASQPPAVRQQYPASPPPPTQYAYSRDQSQGNYGAEQSQGTYETYGSEQGPASNPGYYDQQTVEASQPPPPLPEYEQPECPGDNYIWTPGSWSYSSAGYYWVPGVWVVAPYVNALWTPPYWESYEGRYRWHRGYWGEHIGFYGGINYGFGYTGRGYAGGYWRDGRFNYNRTVNNVNVTRVHDVYNYNVVNYTSVNRVSYNGGRGGIQVRPTPPELAVTHEQRMPPVAAQVQHMRQAAENRAQFASVNQGRPQVVAAAAPLATSYRTPAPRPPSAPAPQAGQDHNQQPFNRPAEMRSGEDTRAQGEMRNAPESRPAPSVPVNNGRSIPQQPVTSQPPAQVFRPGPENRPAPLPQQRMQPQPVPTEPQRNDRGMVFHPVPENRPAPATAAPVFRPENRPVPQNRPAPVPQPVQAPVFHPVPENRPAPPPQQVQPQQRPAPFHPAPAENRPPQPQVQPQERPVFHPAPAENRPTQPQAQAQPQGRSIERPAEAARPAPQAPPPAPQAPPPSRPIERPAEAARPAPQARPEPAAPARPNDRKPEERGR